MIYGYSLINKDEFSERHKTMSELGIADENIFVDARQKQTFETTPQNRPQFMKLLEIIKPNDMVYLKTIDDLGYGYEDILAQWIKLTRECQVDVAIVDMPLVDTRWRKEVVGTYVTDVFISIFGYMADKRKVARQHQQESFARSRAKGVRFGAPPKAVPSNFSTICDDYASGKISLREGAKMCGMTHRTFKNKVAAFQQENTNA